MAARVSTLALAQGVEDVLTLAAPLVNVYLGAVPATPPADPDGRVHVYAVLYPTPGAATQDRLVPIIDGLTWSFQVTCVGGDPTRCLACVDAVTGALTGRPLALGGIATGWLRELGDPGPAREDRDATPSRWFVPLTYQLFATRRP